MDRPSRLFVGYRALGFTSNAVPLCVRYDEKRRENYVLTCVGRAFHTYNVSFDHTRVYQPYLWPRSFRSYEERTEVVRAEMIDTRALIYFLTSSEYTDIHNTRFITLH